MQVISRAAAILRALKDSGTELSLGRIAKRTGLPRSTVQRIAGALAEERLVAVDPERGGLRLGPELESLAEAARASIVERCRGPMNDLAKETGETVDLSVMNGSAMVFLDQVPGVHRLRAVSAVGAAFPLTTTANGRACLAMLGDDQARALAEDEWKRRKFAGDMSAFAATLAEVRRTGLAYDLDEHTEGISAGGFAFRCAKGDIHAISVPVPTARFVERRHAIEAAVRKTAKRIAELLPFPELHSRADPSL